jgi:hypothetical protein
MTGMLFSTNDATAPVINNGVISSSTIANKDVLYAKVLLL